MGANYVNKEMVQMQSKNESKQAMLLMVLVAVLWSIGGICIKMISWHPFTIASLRGLIAFAIMLGFAKKKGYRMKFNKFTWMIALAVTVCMTVFIFANKLTTAANAIVIQYLCPVWILIIGAVFLHQKIKRMDVIAVVICIAGIALFFMDQLSPGNMLGNVLAIISGIAMAVLFTGNNACGDIEVQYTGLIVGHFLTFLVGLSGFFMEPFHTTVPEIGFLLMLGVLQMGVPYILFAYVSSRISPLACSLIGMLEPLLNPIWVAIFYGEIPGFYALIGGVIIIVTTSIWCILQNKTESV